MVYDGFLFFNELDMLDLRLHVLSDVVDRFVVCESNRTFTGNKKPLFFHENRYKFKKFLHKIEHIIVEDMPDAPSATYPRKPSSNSTTSDTVWHREAHQRNAIIRGVPQDENNTLILSDVDEIPRPEAISLFNGKGIWALEQELYFFFFNCRQFTNDVPSIWIGPLIGKTNLFNDLEECRRNKDSFPRIVNGGWHFTFIGGMDNIKYKLNSYAHQELNTKEVIDAIVKIRKKHEFADPFVSVKPQRQKYSYRITRISDSHPKHILENPHLKQHVYHMLF